MDSMTLLIIVICALAAVLLIAIAVAIYLKVKGKGGGKSKKPAKPADVSPDILKTESSAAAAEPVKTKKSDKVKRPVILTPKEKKTSQDVDQQTGLTEFKTTSSSDSIMGKPADKYEDREDRRMALRKMHDDMNATIAAESMKRASTDVHRRPRPTFAEDNYRGISMDDLDISDTEIRINRYDDDDRDYRRDRDMNFNDEFKNMSPEMKKILIGNVLDKKNGGGDRR